MLQLYAELFPEYAYYLPYMAYKMTQCIDSDPVCIERWWLIDVEGQHAALNYIKYAPERGFGFLLSIGILPQFRHFPVAPYARLSEWIIAASVAQITADAAALGKPTPRGIVAEVQRPEPDMTPAEQEAHRHSIARFRELGFLDSGIDYHEPPYVFGHEHYLNDMDRSQLTYHRMLLAILPLEAGQFDFHDAGALQDCALSVLVDHYKLPLDHWAVQAALTSIESRSGIQHHD